MIAIRSAVIAATVIVATAAPDVSSAEDLSPPLSKAEVEPLVVGKSVHYLRKRDNARIGWDFKSGDDVYFTTTATQRNIGVAGTYRIADDGAICFKWNADKYLTLTDGCVRFRRAGDQVHVVGYKDPDNVLGDVIAE